MMKTLAAGSSKTYNATDNLITSIERADAFPNGFTASDGNTISSSASLSPIYAWYDNGTVYFYSAYDNIEFNENAAYFFWRFNALTDIDDYSDVSASNIVDMEGMFGRSRVAADLDAVSSWDVSGVKSMNGLFYNFTYLTSVQALSNWDTSSVTDMASMFYSCTGLTSLQGLSSWNTSSVTSIVSMFNGCSVHPTFTNRAGTWDSNGSFIPS